MKDTPIAHALGGGGGGKRPAAAKLHEMRIRKVAHSSGKGHAFHVEHHPESPSGSPPQQFMAPDLEALKQHIEDHFGGGGGGGAQQPPSGMGSGSGQDEGE